MQNSLWTEKYRPKTSDEIECEPHIKRFLEKSIENGFPHLLLYGPPGTGKTTFASLLNPTFQLNASDDRGIDTIRTKIKMISNTVKRQVIVLDECENLTRDAQTCLRRMLEDYPNTTFIFCTNYQSKIIDPLKSRLLKIKFTLKNTDVLQKIAKKEDINIEDEELYQTIFEKCNHDLRRSINVLQGLKPLNIYDIDDLTGNIKPALIDEFKRINASDYLKFIDTFISGSYGVLQLIIQISNELQTENMDYLFNNSEIKKSEFIKILSDSESKSMSGCSDELVLRFICVNLLSIISKK